jgi:hypothetical protein
MDRIGLKRLGTHGLLWTVIAVTHALVVVADAARRGGTLNAAEAVGTNLLGYLPWVGLSWWLAGRFARRPELLGDGRAFARLIVITWFCFFIPQTLYQVVLMTVMAGRPPTAALAQLRSLPLSALVLDTVFFVATGGVVAAWAAARQRRIDAQRQQRLDEENAELRLKTARQQLQVLQAQLEPHFLFNALNAIGATVRTGDRDRALEAIQQLAALLRFAVGASRRERITWEEELAFVADYLALQRLRFGNRLIAQLATTDARLADRLCPPLVLQPLVENAIRHSVERAQGPVELHVEVEVLDDAVRATLRNPVVQGVFANPGLGAGLRSLRERLRLAYPAGAQLETRVDHGQFIAVLVLPSGDDD